ncbi:hypothetical protein N7495_006317 [Penicillium taxi]|uniref:uncharacterized protein n=1 Tax=Penicillium taxi TaxID=168475 RepID=UPI0025454A53|nr:uncharacterized protein N7495_006317 [Penicillium taxi]KAJ5894626.1 hypothetical protein N7495_006317 [Penicillium taxi]
MDDSRWPTFIVETGMSEGLLQLERDVLWWFNNSGGETHFVLLINITTSKVSFFSLATFTPNSPSPLSLGYIGNLRRTNTLLPMTMTPLIYNSQSVYKKSTPGVQAVKASGSQYRGS